MRDIDIEDNGEEWDIIPHSEEQPEPSHWEALPFVAFVAFGIIAIVASAVYRVYQFLQA